MSAPVRDMPRFSLRMPEDLKTQGEYWAKKKGMSLNDFIVNAIDESIRHQNGDYDLPTLEIARLNQLVGAYTALERTVANQGEMILSALQQLVALTKGQSYLNDLDDDGEVRPVR